MENINELVELAQQLDAAMDDDKSVFSVNIGTNGRISFLADPKYILRNFENVDVIKRKDKDCPFKLEAEIEGVGFDTYVHLDEVELLRGRIPNEWIDDITKSDMKKQRIREISKIDSLETKKAD